MADLGSSSNFLRGAQGVMGKIGRGLMASTPTGASVLNQQRSIQASAEQSQLKQQQAAAMKTVEFGVEALKDPNFVNNTSPEDLAKFKNHVAQNMRIVGIDENVISGIVPPAPDLVESTVRDNFGNETGTLIPKVPGAPTKSLSGERLKTAAQIAQEEKVAAAGTEVGAGNLAGFGQTDKVTQRRRLKSLETADRQLSKAQEAWDAFKLAPGSGGITGAIADTVGGLIGQIPGVGESLEDSFNVALTGGTVEENTRARTKAITLAADMLSEITGEESGRFTEAERELAFRALRQLNKSSSPAQIAEAYRTFTEVSINSKDRILRDAGEPPKFDVSTKDGALGLANNLINRGFTREQAIDAVKRRVRERSLNGG